MTVTESMNPPIAGTANRQPATMQAGMFRGYVIVTLALICWAGVIAAVAVGLTLFSN